jgi:hypothetical protein
MSSGDDLPSTMQSSCRRRSESLTTADTERLLARCGVHPEAPAVQHVLASLLGNAAGPPSDQELAGEVAAVAAFMLVTGHRDARYARGRHRLRVHARRGQAITAGVGAALLLAISGTAAANALPAPIQELAHRTFGVPAPRQATPTPKMTIPPSGHGGPVPEASPSLSAHGDHGKAKAVGKTQSPAGSARGKAKGRTVPPGHQKS